MVLLLFLVFDHQIRNLNLRLRNPIWSWWNRERFANDHFFDTVFFDSYTETYDFWSSWNRERFANDHFFDTIFLDSYTEMYDFCEMFARCILDPHLLFFSNFSVVRICLVFSIRVPRSMIFPKCLHDASWILIFFVSNFLYCKFVQYSSRFMYLY